MSNKEHPENINANNNKGEYFFNEYMILFMTFYF